MTFLYASKYARSIVSYESWFRRQIGRLLALENAIDIGCRVPNDIERVWSYDIKAPSVTNCRKP
jgi:hypothetical protein